MKSVLTTLVLGMVAAGSFAQEALPEPEYVNEAYLLKGGKLDKVEMATLKFQSKTSNYFVSTKGTTFASYKRQSVAGQGCARCSLRCSTARPQH